MASTTSFPRVFFQFLEFSRQHPSFSAQSAAPMTKTDLIFPAFSSRFVDFAVQLYSARSDAWVRVDSGVIFLHQSQFFATDSNQLNCFILYIIDHVKWLFFVQGGAKAGQKAGFRVMLKYLETKKAFRYYIRTSVTHSAAPRVPLFCSYYILTSSVIYYWTDARQHGIYLLNIL